MKRLTSKAAKELKKSQFDNLVQKISHLAASLRILEAQAKEAGIFLCERELLECKCGFIEDVALDGRLITYKKCDRIVDAGLRFKKVAENNYVCPICKSRIKERIIGEI